MAWEDIDDYKVGKLSNQVAMAALKGDIEYLKAANYAEYHHPGTGGDYTLSPTLGVGIDLDSTNFSLTIDTYGGPVFALFSGVFSVATAAGSTGVLVHIIHEDPVSHVGRNLFYGWTWSTRRTIPRGLGGIVPFLGLKAGSHNFRVVWTVFSANGTATCYVAYRPYFAVVGW